MCSCEPSEWTHGATNFPLQSNVALQKPAGKSAGMGRSSPIPLSGTPIPRTFLVPCMKPGRSATPPSGKVSNSTRSAYRFPLKYPRRNMSAIRQSLSPQSFPRSNFPPLLFSETPHPACPSLVTDTQTQLVSTCEPRLSSDASWIMQAWIPFNPM